MKDKPASAVIKNIQEVLRNEESLIERRNIGARIGELVGNGAGSLTYICLQMLFAAAWIIVNEGALKGFRPFDPFPYALLAGILALESVLLACFVLMKQAHEAKVSDQRAHLSLQVSLLVETEVTKVIQMLERMSAAQGIEDKVVDHEARELDQKTEVGDVVRELDRQRDDS